MIHLNPGVCSQLAGDLSIEFLRVRVQFNKVFIYHFKTMEITEVKVHPRSKFTKDDDEKLINIVSSYGASDWSKISALMGNKNPRQCQDRWNKYLCPNVNRSPFSIQEDQLILELFNRYGGRWVLIAKHFNNRSDVSIKSRFRVLQRRNVSVELLRNIPQIMKTKNKVQEIDSFLLQRKEESSSSIPQSPATEDDLFDLGSDDFLFDSIIFD